LARLPAILGAEVRVVPAPCMGRCETAPVAMVGQNPLPHATPEGVAALVHARALQHPARESGTTHPFLDIVSPPHADYAAYRARGGYALARACLAGERQREDVIAALEHAGLRGLGGAGFPTG